MKSAHQFLWPLSEMIQLQLCIDSFHNKDKLTPVPLRTELFLLLKSKSAFAFHPTTKNEADYLACTAI